ncbi:MAG: hypothetical protein QNJ22_08900 [Desulfosarcinaceae bacterium]|nr:hypothetical protein [Desulfosarcinaceae bacterium]
MMGCGKQETASEQRVESAPAGFTFLDLGANTPVGDDLRDRLKRRLGSVAIVRRTTIDLDANFPGLLQAHFSDLAELNRRLNWPPRERVEHAVTQLTYRYIDPDELPFDKVVLLFADATGLPVLLNAYSDDVGASLRASLEEKYGVPTEISWNSGRTWVWTQGQDRLLFTAWRDQYDRPRHTITIYYSKNLQALMALEEKGGLKPSGADKSIF